ncbi:uroporphyrinogen-III synthase [Dactylosporangium sp. CA-233914]|uniref:uroporphyrinogen-III synthase n=1 Tax=Dactylosporangium sp. CA-233914 TaxID=3239934 RepID=UPI003D910B3C
MAPPARSRRQGDPDAQIAPLAGYSVAVASERRKHVLAEHLAQAGARTIGVQASRSIPQIDQTRLRAATDEVLAGPCDELVVSSAFGLRSWFAAAGRWGLADALLARFGTARLLARDARAADSLREIGLSTVWSTAGACTEDLFRYLLAQPVAGSRIVVQTDTVSLREPCRALRAAGADVVEAPTFQSLRPAYAEHLRRLVDQIVNRQINAAALLGAPATEYLLAEAKAEGRLDDMLNALCDDVLCACLGAGTAAPLVAWGVHPIVGAAPFAEELAVALLEALPRTATRLEIGPHALELRGQAVVLDGRLIPMQAGPLAVLRALARQPGRVVSSAEIRRSIPNWSDVDDHAIEMAVSRLRRTLDGADLVHTVMKRGYRLAT